MMRTINVIRSLVKTTVSLSLLCTVVVEASAPVIRLTAPDLSPENFIGYNIGMRPCRSKGIRLEGEKLASGKLLVHNYGHGGAGVSLSWGCAHAVADIIESYLVDGFNGFAVSVGIRSQLAKQQKKDIAVVGAGINGMVTAYHLSQCGYKVTLYADAFTPDTTSNVAVGVFTPDLGVTMQDQELLDSIKAKACECMNKIVDRKLFAGVRRAPGYYFSQSAIEQAQPEDLRLVDFGLGLESRMAAFRECITVDIPVYIQDLFEELQDAEVTLVKRHFASKEEIFALPESIIVNCTGLASRELFDDKFIYPVRGEVLYFQAQPGVDYRLHFAEPESDVFTWFSTWGDRIIIGGSLERGVEHYDVDVAMCNRLYANMQELIAPGTEHHQLAAEQLVPAEYCNAALRESVV